MIKCVAIRVDFDEIIGYGHIFRAVNVTNYLLKNKIKVILITLSKKKIKKIINKKIIVEQIKDNLQDILTVLNKYNCKILISDISYGRNLKKKFFFIKYNEFFNKNNIKTISFDDPEQFCSSDLSIVPYASKSIKIKKLKKTKLLQGLEYAIMPDTFKNFVNKKIKEVANKILVVIGGTPNKKLIKEILLTIIKINYPKITAKVFIGATKKNNFFNILEKNKKNKIILFNKFKTISNLLLWSDIAIVGEGLIKYEVVATRTPGFFVNNIPVQTNINNKLIKDFSNLKLLNYLDKSTLKNSTKISKILSSYMMSRKNRLLNVRNSRKVNFNKSLKIIKNYI
ncbi:hypothetical protein N9500_00795 [Candidatus Pelagibacter sp.]|jgi:spore coat polysaccharide biosynthesis predicted glycosyltransferase SpsG|nr:hypothetical protein [Candidatus Pelagibacter sp.]